MPVKYKLKRPKFQRISFGRIMQNYSEKIRLATESTIGWYLKATNDIEAGETILEEPPLFITPHWDCERMKCASCQQDSFVMCKKCNFFPLCLDCVTHNDFDCQFMSQVISSTKASTAATAASTSTKAGITQDLLVKNYAIYAVLKLLLLMENQTTRKYCEPLFPPKINLDEDFRSTEAFLEHAETVVQPLITSGILSFFEQITERRGAEIDADFLHELCFLIDLNGFEVTSQPSGDALKAVYTSGTKIPHNCVPNTVVTFDDRFNMKIYAALPIRSGETIFNSYVNPLMGTTQRQLQLQLTRHTSCHCMRCSDPTELNTHMSSLKCQQCTEGFVLPEKPLTNGNWKCNSCGALVTNDAVNSLLSEVGGKLATALKELPMYEELLDTYASRFHPNHFIIVDIKQNIASLLTDMLMNPYAPLDRAVMERKLKISEEILSLVRVVQPGISKLYTIALYDYLILNMELTELKFEKKEIDLEQYALALQRTNSLMHDVVTMLSYEPTNSAEGQLAQRLRLEKKQIEQQLESLTGEID